MPGRPARRVRVSLVDGGRSVADAGLADSAIPRMIGLLGRDSLAPGDGLVLTPCNSIHTCFMRFAIDVVFLDRAGTVLRAVTALRPFRYAWGGLRAKTTIELPAGSLDVLDIRPGAQIRIEPA